MTDKTEDLITLKQIDNEDSRFVIYEDSNSDWYGSFIYSPLYVVDLSMLIPLSNDEKSVATLDRNYLIQLSEKIRDNYDSYLLRAVDTAQFEFV